MRKLNRRTLVVHSMLALALATATARAASPKPSPTPSSALPSKSDADFKGKLAALVKRLDKSIELTRDQVARNPSAPFIPDLYLQLGQLLSEKADALYYQEAESSGAQNARKSGKVMRAIQDAAQVFKVLESDFPKYEKRPKGMLLLAASLRASEDDAGFIAMAKKLIQEFPDSVEAAKARLLLGEHYFEKRDYDEALVALAPALESKHPYERNAARYKTGLILLAQEKFKDALTRFEQVAKDPELEPPAAADLDAPDSRLAEKHIDLKREALVDSVRAYTSVHSRDEDPVPYYSRLSPNEVYFQEAIEKLAYRYILLKEYRSAVKLLRAVSERVKEPQKVVKIYFDVLSQIPREDRSSLNPEEMDFVLRNLTLWLNSFEIPEEAAARTKGFFETQLRELGTSAHDAAKTEAPSPARARRLERAAGFYRLYVETFQDSPYRIQMALNLGDAEYLRERWMDCGNAYLRVFQGEYGQVQSSSGTARDLWQEEKETVGGSALQEKVIQNAILCFEKSRSDHFYEKVRARGLLIQSIRSYIALKPALERDPRLNFILLKAQYEQGFYANAMRELYEFIGKNRDSQYAVSAGELVLDYYNTRNDIPGLTQVVNFILRQNLPHPKFVEKVEGIRKQLALRRLSEKVDLASAAGKGGASESQGYLSAALASNDEAVRDVALQQALAKSRAEGSVDVFLRTSQALLSSESNPTKREDLLFALAQENLRVTRFYAAVERYSAISADATLKEASRAKAFDQALALCTSLRDPRCLSPLLASPAIKSAPTESRQSALQMLAAYLQAQRRLPDSSIQAMLESSPSPSVLLALWKTRAAYGSATAARITEASSAACSANTGPLCAWLALEKVDGLRLPWLASIRKDPGALESLEAFAGGLKEIVDRYGKLDGSGDPHLDSIRAIRLKEAFEAFSEFLARGAAKNPDLASVLAQKKQEADQSARQAGETCAAIAKQPAGKNPASGYCLSSNAPAFEQLLYGGSAPRLSEIPGGPSNDVTSGDALALQSRLFKDAKDGDALAELSATYLSSRPRLAMAAALVGLSSFSERAGDFHAVAACAAQSLGLAGEAAYHAKEASDFQGLKKRCTP